jgi:hypothetical protein
VAAHDCHRDHWSLVPCTSRRLGIARLCTTLAPLPVQWAPPLMVVALPCRGVWRHAAVVRCCCCCTVACGASLVPAFCCATSVITCMTWAMVVAWCNALAMGKAAGGFLTPWVVVGCMLVRPFEVAVCAHLGVFRRITGGCCLGCVMMQMGMGWVVVRGAPARVGGLFGEYFVCALL